MTSYTKGSTSISYTYDASGLRASKTVNGETTIYQYVGDKLYYEQRADGSKHYYFYDSYGNLAKIYRHTSLGQKVYNVVTNAQGDVIALYDFAGVLVCTYEYDAWGNLTSVKNANGAEITSQNHIAFLNPIRYRGYYFDNEIGMYYLQSRYYDPDTGRFINADAITDPGAGVLNCNIFLYCANNPVNLSDPSGYLAFPGEIHKAVVDDIAEEYGLEKEQTITYDNGLWGRADLISDDGEVWDVKRNKPKQVANGVKQVQKYVNNKWKNRPNVDLKVGGNSIQYREFFHESGFTTYQVKYWYAGDGVIAYDYYEYDFDTERAAETAVAVTTVTVAVVVVVAVVIFVPGGVLILA